MDAGSFWVRGCLVLALGLALACGDSPGDSEDEPLDPPPEGEGFQIVEDEFIAEPGDDLNYCDRFAPPTSYADKPIYVVGLDSRLPMGTHHFFMAYTTEPDTEAGPCWPEGPVRPTLTDRGHQGFDAKIVLGAGQGRYTTRLPPGYGTRLEPGGLFQTNHHVFNVRAAALTMGGTINVRTAPAEEIHHPVQSLACDNRGINIPPNSSATVTATCTAPFDLDLVVVASHAHQHLTLFEIRFFDGEKTEDEPFYTSRDWDSPVIMPFNDEPMHLEAGQGLTYTCHFTNNADVPVTWGVGDDGEMCATLNRYAYPADRPNELPPTLGTAAQDDRLCHFGGPDCCNEGGKCLLVDTTGVPGAF